LSVEDEGGHFMKVITKDFHISTRNRCEFVDITDEVASFVGKAGVKEGDAIVYCPHTTAGITVNENADPSVIHDILLTFEELVPRLRAGYRHDEGNSDAHCKSTLVGCSKQFVIRDGRLVLGTWQGIFFCEFDGPRSRSFSVQVRGE
jgi:secondary thiamine-phosphate synthase enzyme